MGVKFWERVRRSVRVSGSGVGVASRSVLQCRLTSSGRPTKVTIGIGSSVESPHLYLGRVDKVGGNWYRENPL